MRVFRLLFVALMFVLPVAVGCGPGAGSTVELEDETSVDPDMDIPEH